MALSVNPASLKEIKDHRENSDSEVDKKLEAAQNAFLIWHKKPLKERATYFKKLADVLNNGAEIYGKTITEEMGKVFTESVTEIKKCASTCSYFAENGERFLSDIEVKSEFQRSLVTFNPLGVVLAVMPWNFPFWQVLRAAIPAILAGNTVILKHSSNVSNCALLIEEIFKKAGFAEGIFQTIIIPGKNVERVIKNKIIKAVTFTGSTDVGKKIARAAGENVKKCVLELGGNDPYIILDDADVELAAKKCTDSRLINAGQSCISAKRFIATAKVYDEFLQKFTDIFKQVKFGDPFDKNNKIGSLVSLQAKSDIGKIVDEYIKNGSCRLVYRAENPNKSGAYFPPTILEVVDSKKLEDREIFGPVAIIQKARDETDAIDIANNSNFGLGAAIFSKDIKRAEELAKNLVQSGNVFINDLVKSDPRFPFGGVKESGYGRELSEFGIREFTNIKTVIVA